MKLTVIDPNVTRRSPSMRAWVDAFPAVRELFDEVEIWASECELEQGGGVSWRPIPQRVPTWRLHALDFQRRASAMLRASDDRAGRLVQVTGCMVADADIHYIHFWNEALLEERAKRAGDFPLGWPQRISAGLAARRERRVAARSAPDRAWWVVSRSLAERIERGGASGCFRVLPNQYDPARFHPEVRASWRERARERHGIGADEKLLVFSAFGHFERKGLGLAARAVARVRERGHPLRLLVLGGSAETIEVFRKRHRGDLSGVVFAGMVDEIEQHLAAADGLLFPSHFEAFSLAEIEAAALGLRLYLTPHYGSEMILRDPLNGRRLPWDPDGMAGVLIEDLEAGRLGEFHRELGEALDPPGYREALLGLYREALERKRASLAD